MINQGVTLLTFHEDIEKLVKEKKLEYIEAIMHWCTINQYDVESAASLIKKNTSLKSKVRTEAKNLNSIKK